MKVTLKDLSWALAFIDVLIQGTTIEITHHSRTFLEVDSFIPIHICMKKKKGKFKKAAERI